jgi:alanyl-tRNA synthetase
LTKEEIEKVENEVNEKIMAGLAVNTKEMAIDEAKKIGAMALFGEKYGDKVRVVNMGDYSLELCGGTHIHNTSEAGIFKIISEQGVAAGVRRIEALTSENAIDYYKSQEQLLNQLAALVKSEPAQLMHKVEHLLLDMKTLQSENEKLKSSLASSAVDELLEDVLDLSGVKVLVTKVENANMDALRDMGDKFKEKLGNCVIVLGTENDGKVNLIAMAADEAVKAGAHAGNIIKVIAKIVGGGGGGRPNMAQAGGKNPEKIDEALKTALEIIKDQIS